MHIVMIANKFDLTAKNVGATLSALEIEGVTKDIDGRNYIKKL